MTVIFLLLLAVLFIGLQHYSTHIGTRKLSCSLRTGVSLTEAEEPFPLFLSVANARRLPVLFAHLSVAVPPELKADPGDGSVSMREQVLLDTVQRRSLESTFFLMPRRGQEKRLTVSLPCRGRYSFLSAVLTTGDFLGLKESEETFSFLEEVVVLPVRLECPALDGAFGNFLGDISVRRFILSDPILTVGFHEYTGREPMKDISWPRSLRDGRLMVKEYDHTAELSVMLLLNIDGASRECAEKCFSAARSACEWLEKKRTGYSFFSNAYTGNRAGLWQYLEDGRGTQHLNTVLEGLGRAPLPGCRFPLSTLLRQAAERNGRRKGFILITPPLTPAGQAEVRALENRTGLRVLTVSVTEEGVCC